LFLFGWWITSPFAPRPLSPTPDLLGPAPLMAQAGYTLSVSPTTAGPGASLVVTWAAPAPRPATDWIGLYRIGEANTAYLWRQYTNGTASGSATATAPLVTGSYEFRYFQHNGFTDVARSPVVTIASCTFSLSPTSQSVSAPASSGSVAVSTLSGCAYTAASNAAWITVTSGASGTGSGSVGYSVAANTSSASRTGTLTIAGQTFTVTQSGACSFSISPTGSSFSAAAGTGSIAVSTTSGCAYTAASNASWLTVTSGASRTGSGSVGYSVAANTGSSIRTGTLTVAGKTFTVTQTSTNSVNLAWDPAPGPGVLGYKVYSGLFSRVYTRVVDVGNQTTCTLTGLPPGTNYMAVAAYGISVVSTFSNEVTKTFYATSAPTSSTASAPNAAAPPSIDLEMSASTYAPSEPVGVVAARLSNPAPVERPIELKTWLLLPSGEAAPLTSSGVDGTYRLAPGYLEDFGPLELFPQGRLPAGRYELDSRLLDPVTGEILSEDLNPFSVASPGTQPAQPPAANPPGIDLRSGYAPSQEGYAEGEIVALAGAVLRNGGAATRVVELKVWLEIPGEIACVPLLSLDTSSALPAGSEIFLDPTPLFPVTRETSRGLYTVRTRALDAATGRTLAESSSSFSIR
jgi:hypothetical protein